MSMSRAERAQALEEWAEKVDPTELKAADTQVLRIIADLAEKRSEIDDQLTAAIRSARKANRSWAEIGAMLGVSKQAAQRKYTPKAS